MSNRNWDFWLKLTPPWRWVNSCRELSIAITSKRIKPVEHLQFWGFTRASSNFSSNHRHSEILLSASTRRIKVKSVRDTAITQFRWFNNAKSQIVYICLVPVEARTYRMHAIITFNNSSTNKHFGLKFLNLNERMCFVVGILQLIFFMCLSFRQIQFNLLMLESVGELLWKLWIAL